MALAAGVARLLAPGQVVLLVGEVGTGKTTFVRAAAQALGVRDPVTSPTYVIAQRYEGPVPVAHVDAYRLADADDEELGLVLEAMGDNAITFIEWPQALVGALPVEDLRLDMQHLDGDRRLIAWSAESDELRGSLQRLVDQLRP